MPSTSPPAALAPAPRQVHPARPYRSHQSLFRPIKYSLFPPLGLATLAAYLDPERRRHVSSTSTSRSSTSTTLPTSSSSRSTSRRHIARTASPITIVAREHSSALGGLHVTSLPDEAAAHADAIFLGPGEDIWPEFLRDFRAGHPQRRYQSRTRTLMAFRPSAAISSNATCTSFPTRSWCPAAARTFATSVTRKRSFRAAKRSTRRPWTTRSPKSHRLPGRHLYFLDDHLFGNRRFAEALFDGMRGMGRVWQARRRQ